MSFTSQGRRLPFTLDDCCHCNHLLDAHGRFIIEVELRDERAFAHIAKVNREYAEAVLRFAEDPLVGHPARDCSPALREVFEWIAQLAGDPYDDEAEELLRLGLIEHWKDGEYRIAPAHNEAWEAWVDHTYAPKRSVEPV
jgi:hypothetical protein